MPRRNNLTDMEIDEISTVDKTANQYSRFVISKRAPEEDEMPQIYNQEGEPLDENDLEFGDVVYDDQGQAYEFVEDGRGRGGARDRSWLETGKSAFFEKRAPTGFVLPGGDGGALQGLLRLRPGRGDRQGPGSSRGAGAGAAQTPVIAKSERDLRLTREYISKAAEYNLPVPPDELGPVLYRMAEQMDYDDCAVIAKCLETAGAILYEEVGFQGGGDNNDVYSQVEAAPTTPSARPRTSARPRPSTRCST